jgi:hypothetical protein
LGRLANDISQKQSEAKRIAREIEILNGQRPRNSIKIGQLMDEERKLNIEIRQLETEKTTQEQLKAGEASKLSGLKSAEDAERAGFERAQNELVKEESRLFLKWLNED